MTAPVGYIRRYPGKEPHATSAITTKNDTEIIRDRRRHHRYCGTGPGPASPERKECSMSHHLDTPLAAQTGQLYIDDLYVFPGEGSTVFVMDVNSNVNGLHTDWTVR